MPSIVIYEHIDGNYGHSADMFMTSY
jgi:hypothetical protein